MARRAISRKSLPDVIADDIRERILSGEMGEGTPIRQEALAEEYDVSRMPIREALKRLDAEGLVLFTNNRSASVRQHSLDEIGEIFDLRILLEVDMFRRAIPRMTEDHFARCEELLTEMETSYDADDVSRWGSLNYDYHAALYAAAGRSLSEELLQRLNPHSDRYVRIHLSVLHKRGQARSEHRDLLRLAREGQVDAACDLLTRHIIGTKENLMAMVSARTNSSAASV
jgi:DNA-binding GntR family transcriptional regulator